MNNNFEAFVSQPVVIDGTPDITKAGPFTVWLDLPGQGEAFPVQAGDTIQYSVSLIADTFSLDRGIVMVDINLFGIPANADETLFFVCE